MKEKSYIAWHFSAADCKLGNRDGRLIEAGKTLSVPCEPVLCRAGLHGSVRIIDALKYAPGPYIWRVKISGKVKHVDDKLCGQHRLSLWGFDASKVLNEFARRCALDVSHLWKMPEIVKNWLETGDEFLRPAARSAAWDAAQPWARSSGWSAAWDAARSAAWDAARSAARSAAESSARSAAWDAAQSAARSAAESSAQSAARAVAWSAAWDAARSAAESSQNERLEAMINKAHRSLV